MLAKEISHTFWKIDVIDFIRTCFLLWHKNRCIDINNRQNYI